MKSVDREQTKYDYRKQMKQDANNPSLTWEFHDFKVNEYRSRFENDVWIENFYKDYVERPKKAMTERNKQIGEIRGGAC